MWAVVSRDGAQQEEWISCPVEKRKYEVSFF